MDIQKQLKDCKGVSLLLLRLVVVFIFLYHGLPKAFDWTMATEKFVAMGFPGILGPIVGIVEVVAAVLLLVGLYTKWSSYVLAVIIVVAIVGVQIKAGSVTAGLERDLMILVGSLVLAKHGPGIFSLGKDK